jgi:hypothetical protein
MIRQNAQLQGGLELGDWMLDSNTGDLVPLAQVPSHLELALLAMQGRGRWWSAVMT